MTTASNEKLDPPRAPMPMRLGEELPIFCESCGYSLHGLTQVRCAHCSVLQFHCPECGHHQPINTLRPAVQVMLGRLKAWLLAASVFMRLNFFGWLLFGWMIMGFEWSYSLFRYGGKGLDYDVLITFISFGFAFGLFSRMLLLRWKKGFVIGLILAILTVSAVIGGMKMWCTERRQPFELAPRFPILAITFISVAVGSAVAWPAWVALVQLFLPTRTAKQLLDWQRSLSDGSSLARG